MRFPAWVLAILLGGLTVLTACEGGESRPLVTPDLSPAASITTPTGTASVTLSPTPNVSPVDTLRSAGESYLGLWDLKPPSLSPDLQKLIDDQCESSGQEGLMIDTALERMGQRRFNIWEYWKAAQLHNLANAQWFEACGALSPPANPGFILPVPPLNLIEQIQTGNFKSDQCRTLAQQLEGLYAAITKDVVKGYVYFQIGPVLQPLEERWYAECNQP